VEADGHRAGRGAEAEVIADIPADAGAHRAVTVADRVLELELQLALEYHRRLGGDAIVELAADADDPRLGVEAEGTVAFSYE